ncbi:DedA family protein [Paracoccus tibetensis]|uniref:Membrane protein DedA, SNARE-associated domain n=1 Tax=Paracoccus tibetensis TaxID=336292 RepID=A0A1G5HZS2_9RHOB|nr:VTT domain-containing protein [Paracoccus tibetensis]SCY68558.1 membrane protein DedA, SNARE-associated domain [Paracoccus tibetensis]
MEALIEQYLGNPAVLALLLFLAPFVLEEAAILTGAALAASGEMSAALALAAISTGMIVSDWTLYAIGALAGRSRRIRGWIDAATLLRGRQLLDRGAWPAGLLARLIPWLLFPIFVASGFLGVGFRRFALINGLIAAVYILVLFFGVFGLNLVLFDWLGNWAWAVMALLLIVVVAAGRWAARRYLAKDAASG